MSWVDVFAPAGTFGAGMAAVYGVFVRPRTTAHKIHEKERAELRRQSDGFMYGVAPIEGVTEGALSAPRRLQAVEKGLAQNTQAVVDMGVWQKEANGTAKRTADAVLDIRGILNNLVETGVTSRIQVGKDAADVAVLSAESQTALLEAIHHHHEGENLTSG